MERIPITTYGYAKLETELKKRKTEDRPRIIEAIEEARAHGDLSENAEYHAAKEEQGHNESRIKELEAITGRAQVIDPTTLSGDRITMGATVDLVDDDTDKQVTYILVGPDEADLDLGLISVTSPIGKALLGKEEGDEVTVAAPGGKRIYEIEAVRFQAITV